MALIRAQSPISVWNRWDSKWYLGIAMHGYHWSLHGKSALAFFPLYPLIVHAFLELGFPDEIVALLLSNAAFAGALFYLYRLTRSEWGTEAAGRAVWLLALFPTAFFTFLPYSESLFLLCAVATLYHGRHGPLWAAGVWLALALLTRSTAVILLPTMLVVLRPRGLRSWLLALGPSMCALGAFAVYLAGLHLSFSRMLDSQRAWHRALTYPWTGFTASIDWLARHGTSNLAWTAENVLQLGVTVIFVVLTVMAWRHLGSLLAVYCGGFWLLVLSSPQWLDQYYAPFSSMDRFVLALFPLAGWAAARLPDHRFRLLVAASAALMLSSAAVHLAGGWVG